MTLDHALTDVLERLSDTQVLALAAACAPLGAPDHTTTLVPAGSAPASVDAVEVLTSIWRATPALSGAGIALALRTGLAGRRDADARRTRAVWTGPGATGEQRLTAAVLHELLASASARILLVSYAAFTLAETAADLEAAVARRCRVDVVFETADDSDGNYSGPHNQPFGTIAGITRWRWPAEHRTGGAVLHAKLLVVDGQRALVGSANLTTRALAHNLEVGVLISDPAVAAQLEEHVTALMAAGTLIVSPDAGAPAGG